MFDQLLTVDELEANTRLLTKDSRVSITQIGVSRLGRSIEMISLGNGDKNALIVGVPHPNEPAGAVTVERMIALLLENETQRRGYRWHFIKAIDPEGLRLNEGWLKQRTLSSYLHNFFRPALHRQPETTFPVNVADIHFEDSTPENKAWQNAFELTRPTLHASLHHCDFGGVFYSLSRALPAALDSLERVAAISRLGVNDLDGVMDAEQWTPAVKRYPTLQELSDKAKASGAAWAYPWTVGEMSPGYGETHFGTFTLIAEAPLWETSALHDHGPSGITYRQQQSMLQRITFQAADLARQHFASLSQLPLEPDEQECFWAIERGLQMLPHADANPTDDSPEQNRILSNHDFELMHTEQALFALRTYGLLIRLCDLLLNRDSRNDFAALAKQQADDALRRELAALEARSRFASIPLSVVTDFQMQSIFVCAEALL